MSNGWKYKQTIRRRGNEDNKHQKFLTALIINRKIKTTVKQLFSPSY